MSCNERDFRVGFAMEDITPDYTVCISGYGDDEIRRSEGVSDPIYLTCIAVTDGDETILMYTSDLLSINDWAADRLREKISPETGIPGEKMFFGATHSHSGPLHYGDQVDAVRFRNTLQEAAVRIAKEALADRVPAQMLSATREIPGMNFVRHYRMEDGTCCGSNFGNWKQKILCHTHESDRRLTVVKFAREGKTDVVMMNWQAHNDNVRQVGYYLVSSSYVGQVRKKFVEETGLHFAFFMGASGNQNPSSRIEEENHGLDWIAYGQKMAQHAIETMEDLKPVTGCGIKTKRVMFEVNVDHSWDHMVKEADEVFHTWKTVGKKEGDALGKTYGFTSSYQSRDIRARAKMPATTILELNAFRIGDMGFVTSTNEVFSTVGKYVRANSPFETTFIITGNSRYLPCAEAYEYRSYESDTGLYAQGTAEKVAEKLARMLAEVK